MCLCMSTNTSTHVSATHIDPTCRPHMLATPGHTCRPHMSAHMSTYTSVQMLGNTIRSVPLGYTYFRATLPTCDDAAAWHDHPFDIWATHVGSTCRLHTSATHVGHTCRPHMSATHVGHTHLHTSPLICLRTCLHTCRPICLRYMSTHRHEHSFEIWADGMRWGYVPLRRPEAFWFGSVPLEVPDMSQSAFMDIYRNFTDIYRNCML